MATELSTRSRSGRATVLWDDSQQRCPKGIKSATGHKSIGVNRPWTLQVGKLTSILPVGRQYWANRYMQKAFAASVLMLMLANSATRGAEADALQILGQTGVLGEWELTANATPAGAQRQFSGPLVMKHVGLCTVDGPEEKKGEIQLQLFGTDRVKATLVIDGVTCTYTGRKSDAYNGLMRCPDRRDVPLVMWLKQ